MKKLEEYGLKDIIELAKDNEKMANEINNIFMLLYKKQKGEDYTWVLNRSSMGDMIKQISSMISQLYEEKEKLKAELIDKLNQQQKQEKHTI